MSITGKAGPPSPATSPATSPGLAAPSGREPTGPRPIRCNCQALRQATRRVTQLYDHALAPAGIRVTQYAILHWLAEHGPSTMKALADVMVMDRATLGHNLRPLEAKNLVTRAIGTDRRVRLVSLTSLGAERLADARQGWRDAQAAFERAFGPEEALALRATLARIATLSPG